MKKTKPEVGNLQTVLRRMRESACITMRQAGGIVGISHVAISQFENGKLNLPAYRIEQLVRAYGFSKEEFQKIVGRGPAINHRDDCHAIIDRLSEEQLVAAYLLQLGRADPKLPAKIFVDRFQAVRAMRIITKIDWKPVSVSPSEAERSIGKTRKRRDASDPQSFSK